MKTKTNTNPNHIDDLMLEVIDMQNATNDLEDASYENDIEFKARNSSRCSESGTEKDDDSTDNENDKEDEKEDFTCRKCALRTLLFFVLSAILFGALFATGILRNEDLSGIPVLGDLDLEGFFDTDPYGGLITPETPETAYRWYAPQQSGLQLTVLNALTNDWQQEFEKAMAQWDAGDPDTLTLHSERVEVDVPCEPLNGLLKVCNGDYGATDWRGLNVVLLDMQEKWIYSSTAKMNEHFLSRASAAQRQYTMCHELGHGFGLPHWDTNFYNANMGNCMDYTSRPRTNQQPDASNFNFLKHLYGEVGVTNSPVSATSPPDQEQGPPTSEWTNSSPPPNEENEEINEDGENEEDGNERFLRGYGTNAATKDIPEAVMTVYRSILVTGENPLPSNYSHRLLKSDESSEGVLINLGYENYGLLVYKLRPIDPTNDDEE